MKTSKRNKLLSLALTGSFSLFGASNAFAAANDDILNRATLSYDVGTLPQTVIESSQAGNSNPGVGNGADTLFKEDRVINFTVVRENGAEIQVVPGANQQAIPFLIDNTGNGTHGFLLAGLNNTNAINPFNGAVNDSFAPTTIETYVDANGNGILDPAEIAGTNAYIATFPPGAPGPIAATGGLSTGVEVRVFVVSNIPLGQLTGDVAVMSLVAHAAVNNTTGIAADAISTDDNGNFTTGGIFTNGGANVGSATPGLPPVIDDPATMQTVFNDGAFADGVTGPTVDGAGVADIVQNAQLSSYSAYIVQTADLTVTKTSVALYDPVNIASNPKSIPGGYVTYTISVANAAGAANADLTILSDALPASLDLDPDFVINDGTTPTNAPLDAIEVTKGATTIYCTGDAGDIDGDGCSYGPAGPGGTVSVDFANAAFATIMPLVATETVTINFNVIVQ